MISQKVVYNTSCIFMQDVIILQYVHIFLCLWLQNKTTYRVNGLHGICCFFQACCFVQYCWSGCCTLWCFYFLLNRLKSKRKSPPARKKSLVSQDVIAMIFIIMMQRIFYYSVFYTLRIPFLSDNGDNG